MTLYPARWSSYPIQLFREGLTFVCIYVYCIMHNCSVYIYERQRFLQLILHKELLRNSMKGSVVKFSEMESTMGGGGGVGGVHFGGSGEE